MTKNEIAVLVKDRGLIKFLEKFFKKRKIYRASFFEKPSLLIQHINENPPAVIIIEVSLLPKISDRTTKFPCIAIISGNIRSGIEKAVNHNVKKYMYKPFFDRDLEYKLENIILDKDSIERLHNESKELAAIIELTQLISSTLDQKEILFRIVRKISELMPVTRCSMIRVDWLRKSAFVVATHEDPNITGIKLSLRKYPEIIEALQSKKPVIVKDIITDPIMQPVRDIIVPLGIKSILVLPIIFREKVIGTLFLRTSRKIHAFSANEVRLLNAIANASANALYNAFLFEQVEDEKTRLEKLAIIDYLTGIFNIRYFYHRIIEEFSRCQRYELPLSALMLDIDHFKKVNDVYGHKTGDMVLKEFAQLVKKHLRKSDVLARYGGEEFIILLTQTPLEGAINEAERIRKCVKDHKLKSIDAKTSLTVSIGVASYPDPRIKTHDDLIACSDDALFTAKQRGRDQIFVCKK
jgi:two-component system, cell cycle response regulator